MEDAKYSGRDWIQTGNWPQVRCKPAYNRTSPGDIAQALRCGSPHSSLPLLRFLTSFILSLLQLGIFNGFYKLLEWSEHASVSKDVESIILGRVAAYFQFEGRHDLVKLIATNFVDISSDAKWRKYLKTSWQFDFESSTHDEFKGHLCEQLCQYPSNC